MLAPWGFAEQCAYAAKLGYRALEVAPFTLADDPMTHHRRAGRALGRRSRATTAWPSAGCTGCWWRRRACRSAARTRRCASARARRIARLIELCALLGGSYLVHGSPAQRNPQPGQSAADALARATEAWVFAGELAGRAGLHYCIEPLSRDQTSVVNTIDEALAIVNAAALPGLKTMLDTSSAGATEAEPLPALIDRVWPSGQLVHVQLNDRNRRGPGQGEDRFAPILAALQRQGYAGWLAMEPFDYVPDGPGCAAWSIGYVRGLLQAQ